MSEKQSPMELYLSLLEKHFPDRKIGLVSAYLSFRIDELPNFIKNLKKFGESQDCAEKSAMLWVMGKSLFEGDIMSQEISISDLITAAACASPLEKYRNMSNQEVIDFLLKRVEEAEKYLANTDKGGGGE